MVIKMKDLIAQQKFLNEKFIKEEDPPAAGGGEEERKRRENDGRSVLCGGGHDVWMGVGAGGSP